MLKPRKTVAIMMPKMEQLAKIAYMVRLTWLCSIMRTV